MHENDIEILEEDGWQVNNTNPISIVRCDGSTASHIAVDFIIKFLKNEKNISVSDEDTDVFNFKKSHMIDPHTRCSICKCPIKINILRPAKCINDTCINYYHRKV